MLFKRLMGAVLLRVVLLAAWLSQTVGSSLNQRDAHTATASFDPNNSSSLVLLQMLFRHGDRSAIHLFPWDEHNSSWPQGPGQLTKLGMLQAYKFGEELRKRYADFLPTEYDRFAVTVQSTDYDRTLMTAQCLLVGLFPDNSSLWSPWQPIPIHTQDVENDQLFGHAPCPRLPQLEEDRDYQQRLEAMRSQYKPLFDLLSSGTNTTVNDSIAGQIADTMFCEAQHNMSRPGWLTDGVYEDLRKLKGHQYRVGYTAPGVPRLMGGPLLAEMTRNMEHWAQNASSKQKLFLFSAHDSTVFALSRAMGTFNGVAPPYLTSVVLELHQQGQQFFVQALLHNHTQGSPFNLTVEGCAQMCPLAEFRRLLKDRMLPVEDRQTACALTSASQLWKENGASILTGAVVVLVVAVAVLAYKLRHSRRQQRRERNHIRYHKLLQQGADDDDDVEKEEEEDKNRNHS